MFRKVTFALLLVASISRCYSQQAGIKLGAYYFDGWTGETMHISSSLTSKYSQRMPSWGWITSKPELINKQVALAADAGLRFFSFCWYYSAISKSNGDEPRNNALKLFLKSKYKDRLEFNLLIANHSPYRVGPADWLVLKKEWISYFSQSNYLKVDGKPLITFFDLKSLIQEFGSEVEVRKALDDLRNEALKSGFKGVNVAVCLFSASKEKIESAKLCGFDIFTGYNYPNAGLNGLTGAVDISKLRIADEVVWSQFAKVGVPYIPVSTLGWDRRPWDDRNKNLPWYVGYSPSSVYNSVLSLKNWLSNNGDIVTKENLALLFAWNEYGEGAWLTPTKRYKNQLLNSVKRALVKNK